MVRQSIDENRKVSHAPSIADEISQVDSVEESQNKSHGTQSPMPKAPPRHKTPTKQLKPQDKTKRKTMHKRENVAKVTPKQKGPMDSFISGTFVALRRKLSPEKEADTDDGETKRVRSDNT